MDRISDLPIGFPINNIISLCHEYIDTCIYVLLVHLDIILLVVSDGDDSTECGKYLFENPGLIEVHEFHEIFVHCGRKNRFAVLTGKKIVTSKRRELTSSPQGDHYRNGKGTGINGTRRFP